MMTLLKGPLAWMVCAALWNSAASSVLAQEREAADRITVTRTEAAQVASVITAEPRPHRFGISIEWGVDNPVSGKVIQQASGQTLTGVPINLHETTYDDTYGRMGTFKIGVNYLMSPNSEAQVSLVHSRSGSQTVDIGTAGAATPLPVDFTDLSYWGLEGGQRFLFGRALIKPFAGYLVGANRYNDVRATFVGVPTEALPGLAAQDGKFFEKSWALSAGPTTGVIVRLKQVEFMGELQFRYMGGLSDVDWLVEEGLRDINDESSRWSFPFNFGARFRF